MQTVKQCNHVNYSHPGSYGTKPQSHLFSVRLFFQHYLLDGRIMYTAPQYINRNVLCLYVYLHNTPHIEGGWLMDGLFEREEGSTVDVQNGPEGVVLICSPVLIP